jgi:hypothetical protein
MPPTIRFRTPWRLSKPRNSLHSAWSFTVKPPVSLADPLGNLQTFQHRVREGRPHVVPSFVFERDVEPRVLRHIAECSRVALAAGIP